MFKDKKSRRVIIAMAFYLVAIVLAMIECAIMHTGIKFSFVVGGPIMYAIYYCLISTFLEEYKIWPLVVILGICLFMMIGGPKDSSTADIVCEILEIILFVAEIVVAMFLKIRESKKECKKTM